MSLNRNIDTGSYSGNGSSQTITIGWQPALVMVVSTRTSGPGAGRAVSFKLPGMASANSMFNNVEADYDTNGVTITSTGFSVGSEDGLNRSGVTFYWMAFRDSPALDYGSYAGSADAPPKTITTGRQPTAVFVFRLNGVNANATWWKTSTMSGSGAARFQAAYGWATDRITLTSTGFQLGSELYQAVGDNYVWVALYGIVGSTQHFETGTYVGAESSHTITLGYQPRSVLVCSEANDGGFKTDGVPGTNTGMLSAGYLYRSSNVTITATGFTIHIDSDLNAIGVTQHYLVGRY